MTDIAQHECDVFVGVDVGKGAHHAVALDRQGKRLLDSALPNDEAKLRALIAGLKKHGQILLVVDQPATIGAVPVAVARAEGIGVAYLPGPAMRALPICMPVKLRPMHAMRTSSQKPLVACRIHCDR